MTDAKEIWDAIKSRFGGNDESKKMQKYLLKQQFKSFSVSNLEGLHKAMVIIDGEGVDWTGHAEDETDDYALMAFNSSNSGSDTEMLKKKKKN
nr:xylulose kinase-1 [Tanacetum cinerariifolium]